MKITMYISILYEIVMKVSFGVKTYTVSVLFIGVYFIQVWPALFCKIIIGRCVWFCGNILFAYSDLIWIRSLFDAAFKLWICGIRHAIWIASISMNMWANVFIMWNTVFSSDYLSFYILSTFHPLLRYF